MAIYVDKTNFFEYGLRIDYIDMNDLGNSDEFIRTFFALHDRPQVEWLADPLVSFKKNSFNVISGGAGAVRICWPDGTDTQQNIFPNTYMDIRRNAILSLPSPQGGIRPGLSEANDTWYALYAARVGSGSVLVADDTFPYASNISALNTRYGENQWLYVGTIRNGDSDNAPGNILPFVQVRNRMYFTNNKTTGVGYQFGRGILLAYATATTVSWNYAAGGGDLQIPNHIQKIQANIVTDFDSLNYLYDYAQTKKLLSPGSAGFSAGWREDIWVDPAEGLALVGASSKSRAIHLVGFEDNVLGLGYNPQV